MASIKENKKIVLNTIDNCSLELIEWLSYLRQSCQFGLHKGKLGNISWYVNILRELADALEAYNDDSFTLSDLQDYHDWKIKK